MARKAVHLNGGHRREADKTTLRKEPVRQFHRRTPAILVNVPDAEIIPPRRPSAKAVLVIDFRVVLKVKAFGQEKGEFITVKAAICIVA